MRSLERDFNALLIIILCGVLTGAYIVQFFFHEEPCPLCLLQRLAMISVACGAALNIFFGIRTSHYGTILLSAVFGAFVAIRQISLHVCPNFPSFGFPVLGLSLYTWSFIVFVCCIVYTALLLFLNKSQLNSFKPPPLNLLSKCAFFFIFILALGNMITTLLQCGLGACSEN